MIETVGWAIFAVVVFLFTASGKAKEKKARLAKALPVYRGRRQQWAIEQQIARMALDVLKNKMEAAEIQSKPFSHFVFLSEKMQHKSNLKIILLPTSESLKVEVYIRSLRDNKHQYHVRSWVFHPWIK
jgi:acyl-CoA synthetase (NDP forming)